MNVRKCISTGLAMGLGVLVGAAGCGDTDAPRGADSAADASAPSAPNIDATRSPSVGRDAAVPPLAILVAEPAQISAGDGFTLRYSIPASAAYCRSPNGLTEFGSGTVLLRPSRSMTYEIECPGGPTPVTLTASVHVANADTSSACGVQTGHVIAESSHLVVDSPEQVADHWVRLRSPASDAVVCAIECDVDWITAEIIELGTGKPERTLALPATLNDQTMLRLRATATGRARCDVTTSAGDPYVFVSVGQ